VSASDDLRDLLYGDVPLARWAPRDDAFQSVRDAPDAAAARDALHRMRQPGRASRDHLQAWHELRALGENPEDPARLYGVVVDMPVSGGLDTLAAYRDGTARYLNYSGKILVWETEDPSIGALIGALLDTAASIVAQIGPWEGVRPPLQPGVLRVSMLCAGGLYFGEGPVQALTADPMAGPLITAAARLLQALTQRR
jgi:hypothetical protein